MTTTHRFHGRIAGAGTASGTRLVLGHWLRTPHGPFSDVMIQHADGHRVLLAPDRWVADFVSSTYSFDETRLIDVAVTASDARWEVVAGPLRWTFTEGARHPLGWALRAVPRPVMRTRVVALATDPVARVVMDGVRTIGTAGSGRTEWYAAHDLHRMATASASWEGTDLGELRPLDPPPDFGFSSTPRFPSLTTLTSSVRL